MHVSAVLNDMADAGLEMVDTENLRPHYARTLWAWSDALEAQLDTALQVLCETLPVNRPSVPSRPTGCIWLAAPWGLNMAGLRCIRCWPRILMG